MGQWGRLGGIVCRPWTILRRRLGMGPCGEKAKDEGRQQDEDTLGRAVKSG